MKAKFRIGKMEVVISTDTIVYEVNKAHIHTVKEDSEFTFDAISCAARPVEFSIVNQLSKLNKAEVTEACKNCNTKKEIGVLSNGVSYLMLSPFVERYTFFGEEQAQQLTNDVIDECKSRNLHSLRITQFCMMRSEMPFYPQFKGILNALTTREDSTLNLVYFDVPEDHFYDLKILFKDFESMSVK